jgi:hypothetical protein
MTQTSTARRVATVSGGALLLCLSFGGTALAASTPTSGSDLTPITGVTDPLPLPSPSSSTDPVTTVVQTVQQAAQTAGVPAPTATPTATPAPAPSGKTGGSTTTVVPPASAPKVAPHRSTNHVLGTSQQRTTTASTMSLATLNLGGLRSSATVPAVTDPVVAPQQTAVLAAGQSPALAPRAGAAGLPGGSNDERAPRGLFIALATMVIGALAAGHVKVIQDRLGGVAAS